MLVSYVASSSYCDVTNHKEIPKKAESFKRAGKNDKRNGKNGTSMEGQANG